jgi:WD40 repeat protein
MAIRVLPDGQTVALWPAKGDEVRFWNVSTGKQKTPLRIFPVGPIAMTAAGSVVTAGGYSWDAASGKEKERVDFTPHEGRKPPFDREHAWDLIAVTPDGKLLVAAAEQVLTGLSVEKMRVATIVDLAAKKERPIDICLPANRTVAAYGCGTPAIDHLAVSPDGKMLTIVNNYSGISTDPRDRPTGSQLRVWNLESGKQQYEFTVKGCYEISSVVFAPDNQTLIAGVFSWLRGIDGGAVRTWDLATGKERVLDESAKKQVRALAVSPDGKYLAASCENNTIVFWDLAKGKVIDHLPVLTASHKSTALVLAFAPDGRTLVAALDDNKVCGWSIAEWLRRASADR